MYGYPKVIIGVQDNGGEASSYTGVLAAAAGNFIRGSIEPRLINDFRELKAYYTPDATINKSCSIDYLNCEQILKTNGMVISRVIQVPNHAGILFTYQKTAPLSKRIKFRSVNLDIDQNYEFTTPSELFFINTLHPGSWSENWGIQLGKGTLPDTFKLEVVSNLFENDNSIIKSGGIVRESFDNLNFINFADMINGASQYIEIMFNDSLDANGITEFFSILNDITVLSVVSTSVAATSSELFTKSKYDIAIDETINDTLNDTVVLMINGNRYECTGLSPADTIDYFKNNINEPFVTANVLSPVAPNIIPSLELIEDAAVITSRFYDNYDNITKSIIPNYNKVIEIDNAVAGRVYELSVSGTVIKVRYENSSYTDSQDVHNYKLASLISDAISKQVSSLGVTVEAFAKSTFTHYVGANKTILHKACVVITDRNSNLDLTTIDYTVTKTKDNLKLNDHFVLNYKVETANPDNITFNNIVDFDGGVGHTYSSIAIAVADNFSIPTIELTETKVGKDYFINNKLVNNVDFGIWQPNRYVFKNGEAFLLHAMDPGAWGDDIQISITRNPRKLKYTNTFMIEVDVRGISESFEVSLNKSAIDSSRRSLFIEEVLNSSRFIRVVMNPLYEDDGNYLPIETTVVDATDGYLEKYLSFNMTGGKDGIPTESAYIKAYEKLKNIKNYQINLVNSLGNPSDRVISSVKEITDEIKARSVISVPLQVTMTKDIDKIVGWKKNMSFDYRTILLINDVIDFSSAHDKDVILAPDAQWTKFAGKVFLDYKRVCEPVAGIEKTLISGISGTVVEFGDTELDILSESGINAITSTTQGYQIISQRSASVVPGFLDRFNVSMLTLFQTYQLHQILAPYLNRLNIPAVRQEIDTVLRLYLTRLETSGCILAGWDVSVLPVVGDIHAVDAKIFETPAASLDLIEGTLNLTRDGIKFSL